MIEMRFSVQIFPLNQMNHQCVVSSWIKEFSSVCVRVTFTTHSSVRLDHFPFKRSIRSLRWEQMCLRS